MASKPPKKTSAPAAAVEPALAENPGPVIPFDIIDAPTQRFYALAVYVALNAWRLWDYSKLTQDDADSLWLFLKWALIDASFIYGLPEMRIPWLEWSNATTTLFFLVHALLDGLMMFRIPIPLDAWLIALTKVLYDRELSISERRVKPADILHNASLILGKQTIHILPEGSAMLNPHHHSFCLDDATTTATLPIRINQTTPILIELLRVDLDSNKNETITVGSKQVRALHKQAQRGHHDDVAAPRMLQVPVTRTGLYRLQRVVDESNLEVQRRASDTLVVRCPHASVKAVASDKCRGELSNFVLEVHGTPPLKIKYSRSINQEDRGFSFQSIQPENLVSPLIRHADSEALTTAGAVDASWARSERIEVPLNESLNTAGRWFYSIEEVHDACGNVANYSAQREREDGDYPRPATAPLEQTLIVHERPKVSLDVQLSQCALQVARGRPTTFPIRIESAGYDEADAPYALSYLFTPVERLRPNGEHAEDASVEPVTLKRPRTQPTIKSPGLYTLRSIASRFCDGEILEPATCLLSNPPEPDLSIAAEPIADKCAGNSIGLRVDLALTGTPPFLVNYDVEHRDRGRAEARSVRVDGLRHQLEFRPQDAGHHTYTFKSIQDAVYDSLSLTSKSLVLQQDVKPPASAHFTSPSPRSAACIEEPASFAVTMQGEGPWDLEYEIVHGGRRTKRKVEAIAQGQYTIQTDRLSKGGEYVIALVSVQDRSGCRVFLKDEATVEVRQQRPKASFGQLEGRRSLLTLEGKQVALPVRLTGQAPWTVRYRNANDTTGAMHESRVSNKNDVLHVSGAGVYELVDVHDQTCPGTVEAATGTFEVQWIERPSIELPATSMAERVGHAFVKQEVCEGDEDTVEVSLTGTPPYHVTYEQRVQAERGPMSLSRKTFTAGLAVASIQMETSQAGQVEYRFAELGDYLYDHDPAKHQPLLIQQRVNPRPSARFVTPGKTYKYCKEEAGGGDSVIPIRLDGAPPFDLEIGIKHQSSARPEVIRVPSINGHEYDVRIPHRVLALGNHAVSVRSVRDARGCQRKTEYEAPHVQVVVADVPVISALESRRDFCVGERLSFTLSGTPPFNVFYTFEGVERRATSTGTTFRRIAEKPGNFTITAITDGAGDCRARLALTKMIHPMPSVKISQGRDTVVDIHEGGEAELLFEFGGTPPFEFTYTRSAIPPRRNQQDSGGGSGSGSGNSRGTSAVQETRHDVSYAYRKTLAASQEGTYEVVAVKDAYCAFSRNAPASAAAERGSERQRKLEG